MATALVQINFSQGVLIAYAMESFKRDGWTYDGFVPGPEVSSGRTTTFLGSGSQNMR